MNPVITTAKTFHTPIMYNFNKVNMGVASVLYSQEISPNSYERAMESLKPYIEMSARTKNRVFSCSINPHPKDKVNDELFVKIAKDFMEEMGYGNQPFIVFKHWDIDRHHIHIISPRIDWEGKKINDSWEGERARRIADRLERKYGLIITGKYPALDDQDLKPLEPINHKEGDLKDQMASVILQLLPNLHFQALGELNCLLSKYNITTEPTKTEHKGKLYDGVVYIATDSQGNKVGPPLKGSELGRGCGIYALRNKMKRSKPKVEERAPMIRFAVNEAMRTNPPTLNEFQKRLGRFGVELVVRKADDGRIYGATYVDHENGVAVNGSRLGKDYSASSLNNMYGVGKKWIPKQDWLQQTQMQKEQELAKSTINEGADLADFLPTPFGTDFESEAAERRFQRRVKREERERQWKYRTRKKK